MKFENNQITIFNVFLFDNLSKSLNHKNAKIIIVGCFVLKFSKNLLNFFLNFFNIFSTKTANFNKE